VTIQQSFDLAVQHHQAGKLGEAESLYRHILAHDPQHADALHLLGVIALQSGQNRLAADLIGRAIVMRPKEPQYHNNLGNAWMSLGDLGAASASFRAALALRPPYAEAHYNLGLALQKQGLSAAAMAEYRTALGLKPDYPEAWLNLGILSMKLRQLEAAASAFREVLRFRPSDPQLHYELGNSLLDQGQFDAAAAAYRAAIELRPAFVDAHYNLGIALHNQEKFAAAESAYATTLRFQPDHAPAQANLGKALLDQDRVDAAIEAFHAALRLVPGHPETHFNLGNAWLRQGQREAAAQSYRTALRYKPLFPEVWTNLGNLLQESEQMEEATAAYRRAIEIRPDYADALNNLGGVLKRQGRIDLAIQVCRQALVLKPDDAGCHSNLIYHLHFDAGTNPRAIREELALWNERHARPLRDSIQPHANVPDPSRRIKIGYVSSDFREHVVGRNLLPLFRRHDHAQFEIVCYSSVLAPDEITREFMRHADQWRETVRVSDEDVARRIRQDGVDVLVDLSLHMGGHRLLVFARQPAPVQVTFAGYPGSTGLDTIRYRLTDPFLDPPGQNDSLYSEESIRLPHSFWCFDPLEENPEVNDLPAFREGHVTFGCLNNFSKTNDVTVALWARVLAEVAGSRLLVLAPPGQCREEFLQRLAAQGLDARRVEFTTKSARTEYLRWHHRIDMILDTFPYNGHTTSLDALWMGVPVISLCGEHAVSRAGFSQMSNLDLLDLVASSPDEYVRIAVQWAGDLPRLAELRANLRSRMRASPLMDAPRFAQNIEAAYRRMWQCWCEEKQG